MRTLGWCGVRCRCCVRAWTRQKLGGRSRKTASVKTDCCTEIGTVKVASSDAAARRLSTVIAV